MHEQIEYKGEDCELNLFAGWLVDFLEKNNNKTIAERRRLFISHYDNYKKPFQSMFKLDNNREYCLEFLQLSKEKKK